MRGIRNLDVSEETSEGSTSRDVLQKCEGRRTQRLREVNETWRVMEQVRPHGGSQTWWKTVFVCYIRSICKF